MIQRILTVSALALASSSLLLAREPQTAPPQTPAVRARALGIPFDGTPGKLNAITDVAGVEVGFTTLIRGEGKLEVGKGPVRTGVTAIIPRGHASLNDPVYAGTFSLNGNGEMTGTAWVEESGFLEGPVMITNTHSVGVVRDAVIAWRLAHGAADKTGYWWSLPVVAETWDGWLNDINGFHVKPEDVAHALDTAQGGPVAEGSVGGGTGMICYEFKGGTGTASRVVAGIADPGKHLHDRRARPGQLRPPPATHDRRRPRRQGNSRFRLPQRHGLDHHRGRDRRAAPARAIEAPRAPRQPRPRPHWCDFRQRLRRSLPCLLDRQSRRERSGKTNRHRAKRA